VHLARLIELEFIAARSGRFGSAFHYELLIDADGPETAAHISLIDIADLPENPCLRSQPSGEKRPPGRGVAERRQVVGRKTSALAQEPGGLTRTRIRRGRPSPSYRRRMAGKRSAGARLLARRAQQELGAASRCRGGNAVHADAWDRSAHDALALWRNSYLEQLAARNYFRGHD